jgi:hypothetical protein
MDLLAEEYVVVQAWKKTVAHIRSHNWYSDTLELDKTSVDLPRFLDGLINDLMSPEEWVSDPLRLVLAPKAQRWELSRDREIKWQPKDAASAAGKLRPLAHASLRDQVAATAVMLCLADRAETQQGDPRGNTETLDERSQVMSYGNRLFCDSIDGQLQHRWGSARLYRSFFSDYRTFLTRPEKVAGNGAVGVRRIIVQSDLKQFYDRVSPELLAQKIRGLSAPADDQRFLSLVARVFDWRWDERDIPRITDFAESAGLEDFRQLALPQGLVAAGFFANVVLLDFDRAARGMFTEELGPGIRLLDMSRYVDDLRLVLSVESSDTIEDLEHVTTAWIQNLLDTTAPGLRVELAKTRATDPDGSGRPLLRQRRRMERIQTAISGGFDAIKGEEILDAVNSLVRSQTRYSEGRSADPGLLFSPVPDVRDETVARFGASRFRKTYRSIRPLLPSGFVPNPPPDESDEIELGTRRLRTQSDLDDDARTFALGLIDDWIEDPSNVRLLRIGLDIWPSVDVVTDVLDLLRPYTDDSYDSDSAARSVAQYCLAEIFRAGATETGFVEDLDTLPDGVDIESYRSALRDEAVQLASAPTRTVPWFVMQQVLLYLAVVRPGSLLSPPDPVTPETFHYYRLLAFLEGRGDELSISEVTTYAALARRSLRDLETSLQLLGKVTPRRIERIAAMDPAFAVEIHKAHSALIPKVSAQLRADLCMHIPMAPEGYVSLAELVLSHGRNGPLRNEQGLLKFSTLFLKALAAVRPRSVVTPTDVWLKATILEKANAPVEGLFISKSVAPATQSIYAIPTWCPTADAWRFQLGYLLRFILCGREDFTLGLRQRLTVETTTVYKPPQDHGLLRYYGLLNTYDAFGDDWLPISGWSEALLAALLAWPGSRGNQLTPVIAKGRNSTQRAIADQLKRIRNLKGSASGVQVLPLHTGRPVKQAHPRRLRACVVQTVFPTGKAFNRLDLSLSDPTYRKEHRQHLSAALMAIERMLDLRETHSGGDGTLDLLIFPELAVHPRDVKTHLVPFARQRKTIILAGITYERLSAGPLLANTALWVIPELTAAHGLQTRIRRQGKQYLAPMEQGFNKKGVLIEGFRPCQWLVGYDWATTSKPRSLWLTASICYDATDLCLAADLRPLSDVFIVPALNQDVGTFDQMAIALNYHMFQLVVVANNGQFGGSNAHAPYQGIHSRQVFHLHGQPQASIAFLEIDDIPSFIKRRSGKNANFKSPPAGLASKTTALDKL